MENRFVYQADTPHSKNKARQTHTISLGNFPDYVIRRFSTSSTKLTGRGDAARQSIEDKLRQDAKKLSPPPTPAALDAQVQAAQISETLRVKPQFTSLRYGDPGYGQLSQRCAVEIRTGADNESEMGAFNELMQPQRETDLRVRLDEYLRFGLEAGIFYAT